MKKLIIILLLGIFLITLGSSIDANDSLGNFDGTGNADVTSVPGIILQGANFTTTSAQINFSQGFPKRNNQSINFWFNPQASDYPGAIMDYSSSGFRGWILGERVVGSLSLEHYDGSSTSVRCDIKITNITSGEWNMITFTEDGSTIRGYVNGTELCSTPGTLSTTQIDSFLIQRTNGQAYIIDEIGYWNNTLNQSQITSLYNSGNAVAFGSLNANQNAQLNSYYEFNNASIVTTLNNPSNNANVTLPLIFNSTLQTHLPTNTTTNGTLYIYHSNGTQYIFTNSTPSNNITTFTISSGIPIADNYLWNVKMCQSDGQCTFALSNFSMNIKKIYEDNIQFDSPVLSGTQTTLRANFSINNLITISSAILNYGGVNYTVDVNDVGNNLQELTYTLFTPSVTSNTNKSFYWIVNLNDSTSFISNTNNQTISPIMVDDCSAYSRVLFNYTLLDEDTQQLINNSLDNSTIEYNLKIYDSNYLNLIISFNNTYSQTPYAPVCLSENDLGNTIYKFDSITQYSSDGRSTEFYNIRNYTYINTTQTRNISLYNLNSSRATNFQIRFKNSDFIVVEGALIQISRQYVSNGTFYIVEIPITDSNGQTVAHLVEDDVVYNFVVIKNNEVLGTFNNLIAFCEDQITGFCTITLNALQGNEKVFNYVEDFGIAYSFSYNQSSRILNFQYLTIDGGARTILLNATKYDQIGNNSVCSVSQTSSSGNLQCFVPGTIGNSTLYVRIFVDGVEKLSNFIDVGVSYNYSSFGYFVLFVMVISLVMMFSSSKTMMVISVVIGFITATSLSLIEGSILSIGSSITWLIIAAIILIWKLNSEDQT